MQAVWYDRQGPASEVLQIGELPDPADRWQQRARGWIKSRFWLADWGPRPDEPGCWMPAELLSA